MVGFHARCHLGCRIFNGMAGSLGKQIQDVGLEIELDTEKKMEITVV